MENSLERITIEVFGLGYVGLPLITKLAFSGLNTIGIDKDKEKIDRLMKLELLLSEKDLGQKMEQAINSNNLKFSTVSTKCSTKKISIVCVPTPIPTNTILSDTYVNNAVNSILETSQQNDVIILESSIEVGTTEKIQLIIEKKGYIVGKDFGLAFCPERVDPQNKKWHLENIPRVIYCSDDSTFKICESIYKHINNANLKRVSNTKVAEIVKSFENTFRLVNISLVNELAMLCDKLQIDVKEVIDSAATKPFGFMPFYPGAGAGGHCIPKDPQFLLHSAKNLGLNYTTIENALQINNTMPKYIAESIEQVILKNELPRSVIVCGLAYKPDIEDMRDTPGFKIIKELYKMDMKIAVHDPYFKNELRKKYMDENNMKEEEFKVLESLDKESINGYGCLCIVQHHTKYEYNIKEIYQENKLPFVYDCQNKLHHHRKSKTILIKLGSE